MNKKIPAIIALALALCLAFSACGTPASTPDDNTPAQNNDTQTPQDPTTPADEPDDEPAAPELSPKDRLKAVLTGDSLFYSVEAGKDISINELEQAVFADSSEIIRFAVVDLDGDDVTEVVAEISINDNEGYGYVVLRCSEETVYGYTLSYRSLNELKQDGTFSFSSSATDSGFGSAAFTDTEFTVNAAAYSEAVFDENNESVISYYVDGSEVASDAFENAVNSQAAKADAMWYDLTEANLEAAFA